MIQLLEFFSLSKLHPKHSMLVIAGCVGLGLWTMSYDAGELDSALGLTLVVQMFLSSTGFTSRAFRGHFDPVLVGGVSRRHATLAHFLISAAPGIVGWVILAVTALAIGNPDGFSALAGRRAAAMLIVSGLSWVAGFRLTRGAAGVLWLTLLVAVLLQHNLRALSMSLDQGVHGWFWNTAVLLVCPFLLIGNKPAVQPLAVQSVVLISLSAVAIVVRAASRLDVVLAERG